MTARTLLATLATAAVLAVGAAAPAAPAGAQEAGGIVTPRQASIPGTWSEVVPGVGIVGDDWFVGGDDGAVAQAQVATAGVSPTGMPFVLLGYTPFVTGATVRGALTVHVVDGADAAAAETAVGAQLARFGATLADRLRLGERIATDRAAVDHEIVIHLGLTGAPCGGGDQVYACAGTTIVGGEIRRGEIWLDPRLWDDPAVVAGAPWLATAVIGHALGHTLGLAHVDVADASGRRQMMDTTLSDETQATPGGGDALGLLAAVPVVAPRPFSWASPGDIPLGVTDRDNPETQPGVFRPATGTWYVRGLIDAGVRFGSPGDTALTADVNGDGAADLVVFRPATGTWYADTNRDGTADMTLHFGSPGDIPLAADVNGDGTADLIIFRPATGTWYVDTDRDGIAEVTTHWASGGDVPCAADFDRTGQAQLCVFRPTTGTWYVQGGDGAGTVYASPGDRPVVGDWDGDGRADLAVFRPTTGTWYPRY